MTQPLSLTIITCRDSFQWAARRKGGEEYQHRSAVARLSPADLRALGVRDGARLLLKNAQGEVVVVAKADAKCPKGLALMPLGPYANLLTNYDPASARLPNFKNIPATAEPTTEAVTPLATVERLALERR